MTDAWATMKWIKALRIPNIYIYMSTVANIGAAKNLNFYRRGSDEREIENWEFRLLNSEA